MEKEAKGNIQHKNKYIVQAAAFYSGNGVGQCFRNTKRYPQLVQQKSVHLIARTSSPHATVIHDWESREQNWVRGKAYTHSHLNHSDTNSERL